VHLPDQSGRCTHDDVTRLVQTVLVTGRRITTWVACGAAALAAVLAVSAAWLHWLNRANDTTGLVTQLWPATVLQTLTWSVAGALIAVRRPLNRFGWLFCGAGLAAADRRHPHRAAAVPRR